MNSSLPSSEFTYQEFAALVAIGSTLISAYSIGTFVIIAEFVRKRRLVVNNNVNNV